MRSSALSLLLLFALGACGSASPESAQQEHERRDSELANMLATQVSADPQNPFAGAQTLAEDSIGAAIGPDIDQTWIRMMVEHQEGTVRFADIVLRAKPPLPIAQTAEKVRRGAHARIVALNAYRMASLRTNASAGNAFAPAISETFGQMTQAQGKTIGQTWALKMSAYDRGGVELAGVEVVRGNDLRIKALARKVASGLADEEDELDRIVRSQAAGSRR